MAVPGYEKFMLPMIEIVSDQKEYAVSEARTSLPNIFN
jgi:restriction endonuclease Mrr